MPTACEEQGTACGYIEEVNTVGTAIVTHRPRKSTDNTGTETAGVVQTRKYCVLKAGHAGGHSFRTQ